MSFATADLCDKYQEEVRVLETTLISYGGRADFKGEIITIKLDEDNSDLVTMLRDEQGEGRVVVVDVDANYCAVVGDTLMGFAQKNGWAGIVINGFVRDTKITKSIEVGLLALGVCPRKSPKRSTSQREISINFGGIDFKTGAYLYADEDGVIVSDNILK
jgi:regulator of ribonuclease activity A